MNVFIVCRSWFEGYEDHGWDIMGTFLSAGAAESYMEEEVTRRREDPDDWWVEKLEAK